MRNNPRDNAMRLRGFVTAAKAAEIAHRSLPTIYRLVREGRLKSDTAGLGSVYVHEEALKNIIGALGKRRRSPRKAA